MFLNAIAIGRSVTGNLRRHLPLSNFRVSVSHRPYLQATRRLLHESGRLHETDVTPKADETVNEFKETTTTPETGETVIGFKETTTNPETDETVDVINETTITPVTDEPVDVIKEITTTPEANEPVDESKETVSQHNGGHIPNQEFLQNLEEYKKYCQYTGFLLRSKEHGTDY